MHTPQAGTLSTSFAVGTTVTKEMLRAHMTNTTVLPEGALVTENGVNRPMVSALNGIGINMDALPRQTLYVLQDGVTTELWARESHALQVLREKRINMEQFSLQFEKVVSQNRKMVQEIEEACQMVPELAIPAEALAEVCIQTLVVGVHEVRE